MEEISAEEARQLDEAFVRNRAAARRSRDRLREPSAPVGAYLAGLAARAAGAPPPDELAVRAAADPRAREELIERFLPLVLSLARSYRVEGLELADLVQEGCVGLLRAVRRYDAARGPFAAYATWWVRQALQELRSDFTRPLRLPPRALRELARLKSEHDRMYATERREPSLRELAEHCAIGLEQAEALVRADAEVRSLSEAPDADGEIGMLGDLLEDPLSAADYEAVLDGIAGAELPALLGALGEREREILAARFGLDDRPAERLQEIGERLGISAERVRQVEERALAKLRRGG